MPFNIQNNQRERNVVIYARVSTEHEAQLSALSNQKDWYKPFLENHPEWNLIDEYVDEGITGTSVEKRKEFMRMLDDAKSGKFDLILTREVSRFARNTVDTLQYTRILKSIGVEVFFISDNIKTFDGDGELRLTIMATLAQDESRKTSMRVKAGQKVSMQNGVLYGNGNILGYNRVGKNLVIDEEQAKTVRKIFDMYLDGHGLRKIQFELESEGRKTSTGKSNWHTSTISHILRNPFYCGIIKYNKQFTSDFLEQKKRNNYGDVEQIVVKGSHEPIISEEDFSLAMEIMSGKRRQSKNNPSDEHDYPSGERPPINAWTKLLVCQCVHKFNRKVWHRNEDNIQYGYQCYSQIRTGTIKTRMNKGLPLDGICDSQMIPEWKLDMMIKFIFENLVANTDKIISVAMDILERHINVQDDTDSNSVLISDKENQINKLNQRLTNLVEMRADGEISREIFAENRQKIENKISVLKNEISGMKAKEEVEVVDYRHKIDFLKFTLDKVTNVDTTDKIPDQVIEAFVKSITVSKDKFIWTLRFFEEPVELTVNGKRKNNATISKLCNMQHRLQLAKVGNNHLKIIDFVIPKEYALKYLHGKNILKILKYWKDINISIYF